MGVIAAMSAPALALEAAWQDVIDELATSCARRADAAALLVAPGVVGVLAGAAPVVWVHGDADGQHLAEILRHAPEVDEVYITAAQPNVVRSLERNGWNVSDVLAQTVCPSVELMLMPENAPMVQHLGTTDMAEVRALLRVHGGFDEHVVSTSYGDDFFRVAAPAWLLGARDADGSLIGVVGVRQQGRSAMGFGLTVARPWRATGLSSRLIAEALGLVSRIGAEFMHAQATEQSINSLTGCGFSVVGRWVRLVRS